MDDKSPSVRTSVPAGAAPASPFLDGPASSEGAIWRRLALVGPGRAGTAISLALVARGWIVTAVAGRTPAATSTQRTAATLGARAASVADVGRDADLVIVATPDGEIAAAARELAPSLPPGALVVHLSGARTLHEFDDLVLARPDVRVGSLHPLQSLPSGEVGSARLPGSWCAVDGPGAVERFARTLGMRPFRLDPADRVRYHATACVASNHLVALLGQVERLAADAGVPFEALLPLVRGTLDNVAELGAGGALTGPVARGDAETVAAHLDAVPAEERAAYRALAAAALRLAGRDDDAELESLLRGEVVA
ncbi:MAG TPA: DUF2520 domain-containing protein [Acidimicrobiia bacterium]|nr:DUF2520 domain-containing protein [Acidimicrobiia bacterium]